MEPLKKGRFSKIFFFKTKFYLVQLGFLTYEFCFPSFFTEFLWLDWTVYNNLKLLQVLWDFQPFVV